MQVRTAIGQLAPLTLLKGSITLRIVRPAIAVFLSSLVLLSVPLLLGINAPPSVHDEFAFLLQADTFARGRLANPPHRHWEFFETMHVLQQPTYAAKFPPGQGLAMAAGQKLGNPRYGVILSVALACGATAWLAAGCLPPRWATAAGLLAATHPLVFSWGQSFWGGGMAMLGGALTIGAMLRLARRASWIDGAVLGLGIAILLNSRPFEGVLLLISAMVGLGWIARWRLGLVVRAPIVIPVLTILSATGAWMVLYNYRVTGHPLRLPDLEYTRQYMAAPRFWWMAANAQKTYRHPAMEAFHRGSEYQEYLRQTTIRGFLHAQWEKIAEIARDWLLRPPMASIVLLPALVLALMRFRRGLWLATTLGSVPVLEMLLTPWFRPHYLAVVVPCVFAAATIGFLVVHRARRRLGQILLLLLLIGQLSGVGWIIRGMIIHPNVAGEPRARLLEQLNRSEGRHLVFVRYEGPKQTIVEWVYNSADIDGQKVVLARDLGEKNAVLQNYYPDRAAWLLTVRGFAFEMVPLPGIGSTAQ